MTFSFRVSNKEQYIPITELFFFFLSNSLSLAFEVKKYLTPHP